MKVQFQILLFILCLNLATGLVIALSLPGTEYVQGQNPSNMTDYESTFNATEVGESWTPTSFFGFEYVFAGFQFLFTHVHFLLDGFPMFLNWVSDSYIVDAGGRAAFAVICNALRGVYAVLMCLWFVEYIGGRYFTE